MPSKRHCITVAPLCLLVVMLCGIASAADRVLPRFTRDGIKSGYGLKKAWLYMPGDNPAWSDPRLDDTAWQPVPDASFAAGLPADWAEVVWFRSRVFVAPDLAMKEVLVYFQHPGTSELYLDGQLVHSFGKIGATATQDVTLNSRAEAARTIFLAPGEHVLALRYVLRGPQAAKVLEGKSGAPGFACWLTLPGTDEKTVATKAASPGGSASVGGGKSIVGTGFAGLLLGIGLVNFALFAIDIRRRAQAMLAGFAIAMSVYTFAYVASSQGEGTASIPQAIQVAAVGVAAACFVAFCIAASRITLAANVPGEIWVVAGFWIAAQLTLMFLPLGGVFASVPNVLYALGYLGVCFVLARSFMRALEHRDNAENVYMIIAVVAAAIAPALFFASRFLPEYHWYLTVATGVLVFVCAIVPTVRQLFRMSNKIHELEVTVHEFRALTNVAPGGSRTPETAGGPPTV
jgi:hypothetical protein